MGASADQAAEHVRQGDVLADLGQTERALAQFEQALMLNPTLASAEVGRSRVLGELGRSAEALAAADRALAVAPGLPEALRRRGLALCDLERPMDALAAFSAMPFAGTPIQRADILADIGLAQEALGDDQEALAAYDQAVELAPAAALPRLRRAFVRLRHGDYVGGWDDYERRWRHSYAQSAFSSHMTPAFRERLLPAPTVEDFRDRRVLVVAEQGVGDVMMFASILPDLAAIAASVVCVVEPRLLNLFGMSFDGVQIVAGQGPALVDLSEIDQVVAIGSLGHAFRRSAADFPGTPYLQPGAAITEAWRRRLGPADGRKRVGISWQGGGARSRRAARSMSLETLRPLLDRADLQIVNLQYGDVSTEVAGAGGGIVAFPPAAIDDFEQLAGLVNALDAVVTVQTALAHLTGALGRPGLVMIPQRPEWRYGASGSTLPWYRSLRLFRQEATMGWPGVVTQVEKALDDIEVIRPGD